MGDAALDGNLSTFFDSDLADDGWVGLDLGSPHTITEIRYVPRSTKAYRMVGGTFQASNTADFSSGVVTLHTISTQPAEGSFSSQTISDPTAYRYVRYHSPVNGFCNVAEIEFIGIAQAPISLTGTHIGTAGSWGNAPTTTGQAALDGDWNTFFDSDLATGAWVGLDLGEPHTITEVLYVPRAAFPVRMVGGVFQGSNTADFSSGVVTLGTVSSQPPASTQTSQAISDPNGYRYVRYLSPTDGFCNIAEIEFIGIATGTADTTAPSSPTALNATPNDGFVTLDWSDNAEADFASYTVNRSTTSGSAYSAIATGLTSSSYTDSSIVNDTTYYYTITALDSTGNESSGSGEVSATPTGPTGPIELSYDDFEAGIGNYTDGGSDCKLYSGNRSPQGSGSMDIQNGTGTESSFWTTNGIDTDSAGYTQITVEFSFYANSMDSGDSFSLEYYDGSTWHTIATYQAGTDFSNKADYSVSKTIDEGIYTFPTNMQIRFQCNANNDRDDVYVDEVKISAQ